MNNHHRSRIELYIEGMQSRRSAQSWAIAAGGLVVIGLVWIVVNVSQQIPELPVFGMMLLGAGLVCGLVALVLDGIGRRR